MNNEIEIMKVEIEMFKSTAVREERTEIRDNRMNVKLSKLDLTNFDGKILQWKEFWDCFESSIDCNNQLRNVVKLNYLKSKLEESAARVIEGL